MTLDARAQELRLRMLWLVIAATLGAVAVLKGVRLPNLWAASQAQIDYSLGFVKRGFFGEAMSWLGVPIGDYSVFGYLSWLLLLGALSLLVGYAFASGVWRRFDGALLALFGASLGLTYLAHLSGYLDIPLLCLALLALLPRRFAAAAIVTLIATAIGMLIHESYLLIFFPVTVLPLLLIALSGSRPTVWVALAGLSVFAIGLAAFIAFNPSLSEDAVAAMQVRLAARVDFPLRADFFEVLTRSAEDNFRIMMGIMRQSYWWRDHAIAAISMLPAATLFLFAAIRTVSLALVGWRGRVAVCAVLTSGLSPLLLQFLGWDLYRWYALAVITSFLTMCAAGRACLPRGARLELAPAWRLVAILLIGLNMASGEGLMNGQRVASFPFKSHLPLLQEIREQGGRLPVPAE